MDSKGQPVNGFLKADEVDGAAPIFEAPGQMSEDEQRDLSQSMPPPMAASERTDEDQEPVANSARPQMRRDPWVHSAPVKPPPQVPQPPQRHAPDPDAAQDSLSLGQLKRLVADMPPKLEPTPYAFTYADMSNFQEEMEELFDYSVEERARLLKIQQAFIQQWHVYWRAEDSRTYEDGILDWRASEVEERCKFLILQKQKLASEDETQVLAGLECLLYIALGCWYESAGPENDDGLSRKPSVDSEPYPNLDDENETAKAAAQMELMSINIQMIIEQVTYDTVYQCLRRCVGSNGINTSGAGLPSIDSASSNEDRKRAFWASLTLMYLMVDHCKRLGSTEDALALRMQVERLQPNYLDFLTDVLSSLRWDDANNIPLPKLLLLYWKSLLVIFGATSDVDQIKTAFLDKVEGDQRHDMAPRITASPLDYHLFRQEITSKYPAFNPPPPLFPFEPDNSSILPPTQEQLQKATKQTTSAGIAAATGTGSSIIHQPVHIATPAPSPPPSPAGPGGKGIKKQNYQTNQMFPFLYPPLEESSNDIGGKGSTELQDVLVGRKWHGSDIPASILEAADLFAGRMRATRAMKQLWQARVSYMKTKRRAQRRHGDLNVLEVQLRERLIAVETFYGHALPKLQSIVVVLLKVLLQTVTTLVTQSAAPHGLQNGFASGDGKNGTDSGLDPSLQELDTLRTQEIMGKAVSGILLLLLKWFKVSHILKFEYLTQLLVDSNFMQLVLKLFSHQELERVVNYKCEHRPLNLFNFCQTHSRYGRQQQELYDVNADDAAPPPISRERMREDGSDFPPPARLPPPEVDELGFPVNEVPASPITHFSWRAFFSSINYLRILQKMVKSKPHRQLMMIQFKYSTVLRKALKVPQPDVRLYSLKIIKGQVPYCHRKWRQSNMRIITAIYLHCRPSLRDEWLAGIDVDQEMGEASPTENALRALTYWYHLRRYPDQMGLAEAKESGDEGQKMDGKAVLEEEQDFFLRELEKMDIGMYRSSDFDADEFVDMERQMGAGTGPAMHGDNWP